MLDDDARRALEEEAIALVSLSYSRHTPTKARRATPTNESSASTVASMSKPFATVNHVRPPPPSDVHKNDPRSSISMSLFVNGDMNLLHGSKSVDDIGSIHGSHPSIQNDVAITAGFHRGDGTDAVSPTHTDANISMQSLLVTLKKRQHDGTATHETTLPALKLPRFRDVFEPPRAAPEQLTHQNVPVAHSAPVMATPYPAYPPQQAVPQPVPHPPSSPEYVPEEQSSQPVPPELKCKYRTGKCTNIRALKSCGDYHNLCNYHRLRANANQRKLDRKKKVQKGPSSDHVPTSTPSVAAAAALAALPFPQNQHLEHSTQNIPPAPTSSYGAYLRPKLEPSPHP